MNRILKEDLSVFKNTFLLSNDLKDSKFLVTGATGLIGSTLVNCLVSLDKNISIICPVRNLAKAKLVLDDSACISIVECDLVDYLSSLSENDSFDYIVHCASPTSGAWITEHPVETYELAINSTQHILQYARNNYVKSIVYVSSIEFYGQIWKDSLVTEDMQGYIDGTDSRSSYPLGKRAAEYLCVYYANEYGINVNIARLTQTFGAGVSAEDNRVFAQFARSVINKKDIILHTTGESSKPYCYTTDSISGILYVLLKGNKGESYNVANSETYISVKDMAYFVRDIFCPLLSVRIEPRHGLGYAPMTKLKLSTEKLMRLGWKPNYGLKTMFERLIMSLDC